MTTSGDRGGLTIRILPGRLAVCRLEPGQSPSWLAQAPFCCITRTRSETSIVCGEDRVPPGTVAENGWRALEVQGPLDFAETGVLASLAGPLARARISIFALSTHDTDYVLVKEDSLTGARSCLRAAGHVVLDADDR